MESEHAGGALFLIGFVAAAVWLIHMFGMWTCVGILALVCFAVGSALIQ